VGGWGDWGCERWTYILPIEEREKRKENGEKTLTGDNDDTTRVCDRFAGSVQKNSK
jgi:hypothetical protein